MALTARQSQVDNDGIFGKPIEDEGFGCLERGVGWGRVKIMIMMREGRGRMIIAFLAQAPASQGTSKLFHVRTSSDLAVEMVGSTIEASIEQVRPFVERMLGTSAPDGSGAQMKSRTDEIIGALKQANLAYTERLPNRRVIANPLNRDGQGVDPYDVHSLLERILGAG
eukprot:9501504-Pyramimonas_sp.AAC.1